ncbi:MAG: twin-arginine translocation signal domain-containing protein [Planctomycetes bacterium]|nr:twin-arginine translocation signal domain-containing protein [Planctomycetota bacterium]
MRDSLTRRHFLQTSAVLGLGVGLPADVWAITPDQPEELTVRPDAVCLRPEIEPVVSWIEDTPRDRILEVAVAHLKRGLSYRQLLAGLFLAGIRNIQPRPVGFKFHAVLVIHSAHVLGQSAAQDERLLPLLFALDTFKASQAADVKEGDWALGPVLEGQVPPAWLAKDQFIAAMESWDADAADLATVALCRSYGAAEVMELFWRFAIRDQRNIGHKAIFAAQAWRTLQAIGWQHAEPVLRSLAFGLLDRQGAPGFDVVGPYRENVDLAEQFPGSWITGVEDRAASDHLLADLRQASSRAAGAYLQEYVNGGIHPAGIWDGLLKAANELLLRKTGIISLHAVTAVNALHYIFGAAADEQTRRLALLQAASWIALFREALGDAPAWHLNELEPSPIPRSADEAVADIFATIGVNRRDAAGKTLAFLAQGGSNETLFAAARRMIFLKGTDSHDFKFGAAAWEESLLASTPRTRSLLTAGMMGYLPASTTADSPLMNRAREAVANGLK